MGRPLVIKPRGTIFSIRTLSPGLFCHVSQLRIHSIVECGKKPPVLLPSTGGAPIDPAVFGYIRVSQAKVANSLGRVQPCHQRPFYVPPLRPLTGKSVLRTGVVRGITDS